jgi:DNA repair protein RadC
MWLDLNLEHRPFASLPDEELARLLLHPTDEAQLDREFAADLSTPVLPPAAHLDKVSPGWPASRITDPVLRQVTIAKEVWERGLARSLQPTSRDGPTLAIPMVKTYLRSRLVNRPHEVFLVLHFDSAHELLAEEEPFRGTLTQTAVYPREIIRRALAIGSAAVIVAHNHPRRAATPSRSDIALTKTLKAALDLMEVLLLDHLIVGARDVYSLAEHDQL